MTHQKTLSDHPTGNSRQPALLLAGLVSGARRLVLAMIIGAFAFLPLATSPARAALRVQVINTDGQGVSSRSAPRISATNGYGTPANAWVDATCWTRGDPVGPNNNTLWWYVTYSGRQFYVADRYLSTPYVAADIPREPACGGTSTPAPTGDSPLMWVGSPIQGTWDLPASQGGDGAAAHHWLANTRDQGDFAIDLIAPAGQQVILYAAPQDSNIAITAKVDQIGPSCSGGGGGSFVTVGFYTSSGSRIGSATYAHITPSVSVGQSLNRWNSLVGTVGSGYSYNVNCWTGPHVHMQMFSERHYACFNKGYSLGQSINRTSFVGFTGGNVAGAARRACA